MSDLISRKALINTLNDDSSKFEIDIHIADDATTKDIINITLKAYRKVLFEAINAQPTAFDVDEVVRQIQDIMSDDNIRFANQVVNRAINIVKGDIKNE
jgi:hypothetical protein